MTGCAPFAEPIGRFQPAHPGARPLRFAREIVGDEGAETGPVGIEHLEHAHVRMPGGNAFALLEANAEQPRRHIEARGDDALELQIGFQLGLVEGEFLARSFSW